MRHLLDRELVTLVFREFPPGSDPEDEAIWRLHLNACPDCTVKFEELQHAVSVLQGSRFEPPPPLVWARLQARIRTTSVSSPVAIDLSWIRVAFGHIGGIFLALALIAVAGSALESASVWKSMGLWPVCRELGGRGIAALFFFGTGSLLALALAPVLWWESRRSGRG